MCNSKQVSTDGPPSAITAAIGPATEALKRATKRRRVMEEDELTLAASKVSKDFDLGSIFADLPTEEGEAFPTIAWDFDDSLPATTDRPCAPDPLPEGSRTTPSPSKRLRSNTKTYHSFSRGRLSRSKSTFSLQSMVELSCGSSSSSSATLFDLRTEMRLAEELGEAVLARAIDGSTDNDFMLPFAKGIQSQA